MKPWRFLHLEAGAEAEIEIDFVRSFWKKEDNLSSIRAFFINLMPVADTARREGGREA